MMPRSLYMVQGISQVEIAELTHVWTTQLINWKGIRMYDTKIYTDYQKDLKWS